MKNILFTLIFLFVVTSLTAQKKTTTKKKNTKETAKPLSPRERILKLRAQTKERQQDYKYVIKYVLDPKIEKSEKEIPKIEKKVKFYKDKLRIAKTKKVKKMVYKQNKFQCF